MSQNDSQNTNTNNKKKKTQDIEVSSASSTTTNMMTEKPFPNPPPVEATAGAFLKEQDMITVPREQYQTLLQLNMKSFENTLNILDSLDKIIGSLINMQGFTMNIKETIKRTQLGTTTTNNNSQQEQQQQSPSPPSSQNPQ